MKHLLTTCFLAVCALPGHAQTTPEDSILRSLRAKGYVVVMQERTWLGRQRIVVENGAHRREIVFNPGTGEIMRDYAVLLPDNGQSGAPVSTGTGNVAEPEPPSAIGTKADPSVSEPVVEHAGPVSP